MNKKNISDISLFGLSSVILFIVLSLTTRIIYPFGDEPDFSVRALTLVFSDHSWWSPYYWLSGLLSQVNYTSSCVIDSTASSLTQKIDHASCTQDAWQILLRLTITVIVAMPLLLSVVFRRHFLFIVTLFRYKISHSEWNDRLNILSLTLLFPGFIYYFGVLAEEQYVLMISIMIFLLWGNIYVIALLLYLIALIDVGNFLVVSYFTVLLFSLEKIMYKVSTVYIILFFLVLTVIFAILNFSILDFISKIEFVSSKALSITDAYQNSDVIKKYPVYLRPAITFMSFILFTPAYIKSLPAYIIALIAASYAFLTCIKKFSVSYKLKRRFPAIYKDFRGDILYFFIALFTILTLIVIIPNYSNGKYYIFLLPFFLLPVYRIFDKVSILKFNIFINIVIYINMLLCYM